MTEYHNICYHSSTVLVKDYLEIGKRYTRLELGDKNRGRGSKDSRMVARWRFPGDSTVDWP